MSKDIAKILGITDPKSIRKIHDLISGMGFSFQEALEEVKGFFGME